MFPTNLMGCNINHTFQEATAMFEIAKSKQTPLRVVWKRQHEAIFYTNLWMLKAYIGRAHLPLQTESNKIGDVASELRKISGAVTAFIRRDDPVAGFSFAALTPWARRLVCASATAKRGTMAAM